MGHLTSTDRMDNNVFRIELDHSVRDPIHDPNLRHFAKCLRELQPTIMRCEGIYGPGVTMAALVSIAANAAIEHDISTLIADVLRQNASMLDMQRPDDVAIARD